MTLEAFGTDLSLKHRTHFTQCAEFKFTWFRLRSVFTFLRGQQTQVISMRREQLSQLQWDSPPPNICTTQDVQSLPATQMDSVTRRECPPHLLANQPLWSLSSLLLGVRTDVCEI